MLLLFVSFCSDKPRKISQTKAFLLIHFVLAPKHPIQENCLDPRLIAQVLILEFKISNIFKLLYSVVTRVDSGNFPAGKFPGNCYIFPGKFTEFLPNFPVFPGVCFDRFIMVFHLVLNRTFYQEYL